ncbi:MAG: DUF1015 domain-containing protein [Planctomycetes bacterium]|nr:DUF1015 domain-containing protein [Planctomycetota bacterium]
MSVVQPFRALRPTPESAIRVASVPYDVCSTEEARALVEGNPDSFLHVIRAEIDFPPETDSHGAEVYRKGRENLAALEERGALVREETPSLYLYRQIMNGHAQTGLVGTYSVDEYDSGAIVKHEFTRPDKEADRTAHVTTLGAQTGPVFLTYHASTELKSQVASDQTAAPLFDLTSQDGVQHTLWRVPDPAPYVAAFGSLDFLYIADGHHRSAAASNVRRARVEAGAGPDDASHHFLAVAFPSDEVQILPYNRIVHDLGQRTPESFLEALDGIGTLERDTGPTPESDDAVSVFAAGAWHTLRLTPQADDPVSRLAPSMLQDKVLGPLLGITDPRKDDRISFVGGIRGTAELEARVSRGEGLVAFSMPAVTVAQLIAVADAGQVMPPKSTWFEPKLRSGVLTYVLD